MKKIIVIYMLLPVWNIAIGQGPIIPSWEKIDSASGNGRSEAWGIDVDDSNHIYWAVSNDKLNQGLDIYCHKFDSTGSPLWSSPLFYGGNGTQHAYICNASDTAIYIGGRSCTGVVTTCDMLLLKGDKNTGNLIWDRTRDFGANGYEEIDGLEIMPDGIYCGGWCQVLNSSIYESDIGLWKLHFNGNTEWSNYLGIDSSAEHQDGHFVVDDAYIYAAGLWGGGGIANLYNGHSFLGKFSSSSGDLIDSTLFGHPSGNFNDIENALGMTSYGNYLYVTGYTTPISASDWQIFVAKFDKNLNQIWYIDWGGASAESARGIKVKNNKIYIAGTTESQSIMTGGDRDALLLILDTNGNVLDYKTYGDNNKESFQDIAIGNQNIYLTGAVETSLLSKKSILVAVDNASSSTSKDKYDLPINTFAIYPNPSNGITKVAFTNKTHESGSLMVFNLHGEQIIHKIFDHNTQEIPLMLLHRGIFFIHLSFPNYRITRKLINHY